MFNLDYVQSMLAPGAPPVVGFFDSPLWVDIEPNQPGIMPLQNETQAVFYLVNATARLGEECAAYYPEDEQWRCLFGEYRCGPASRVHSLERCDDERDGSGAERASVPAQAAVCPDALPDERVAV